MNFNINLQFICVSILSTARALNVVPRLRTITFEKGGNLRIRERARARQKRARASPRYYQDYRS